MRSILPFLLASALLLALAPSRAGEAAKGLPNALEDTGFDAPRAIAFEPRYPLWSDGASKRRWLQLPPGASIDASNADAWEFPRGTKAWKEFSHAGRVETRFIERLADGSWRYAAYAWDAQGTRATLVPDGGANVAAAGAPSSRYAIPSREDCVACHEGAKSPLLGFSALQLSARLAELVANGTLRGLPQSLLDKPPQIAAATPAAREALGYLHGNCGHCHNDGALPALDLVLAQEAGDPAESAARTLASLVGRSSRFRPRGAAAPERIVPGKAGESVLIARLASRDPRVRMPPVGVALPDAAGIATLSHWIENDLTTPKETSR